MSRFNNLEFHDESQEQPRESHELVKDEAYYLNEAQTAYENGDFEAGLRAFARVLEFNPKNATAWTGQVRMLIELGECAEAKVWADKALEQFPQEPELLAAKAVSLARTGDLKAALAFSDAAIEERGDTPYVWLARADVLLAREEKRADFCIEKALSREPHNWFWHWLAARIQHHYKQFTRALKCAQQALALDAARLVVWVQLGQCQFALGLLGQAELSFQQALQLNPRCDEAQAGLRALASQGVFSRFRGWIRSLFDS